MDTRPIGICFWTCDMRGVLYQALAKCQQCPGRGQGGKGAAGGKTDMVDQGKKGLATNKASMASSGRLGQRRMENQTKAKEKRWLNNGNSRTLQVSGSMTNEPKIVGTALVGNQIQYTEDSSRANKLNQFTVLRHPTKGTRLQALTRMLS